MLDAAWRSVVPGTLPPSFEALANVTRLTQDEVAAHYEMLTDGWVLQDDGRLHHPQLEELAESIQERFGPELAVIADSAALACQGGTAEFELMPAEEVKKKGRGKTAFPKVFAFDKTTLSAVVEEGYHTPELQAWLIEEVRNYALAADKRQSNWQAVVRKFMGSSITREKFRGKFGYPLGQVPSMAVGLVSEPSAPLTMRQRLALGQLPGRAGLPMTFAKIAAAGNSSLMADAVARKFAPTATSVNEACPAQT